MGELFQYYFEKNNISSIEPYLCSKMKELVGLRNKAVSDKNMYDYEKNYVLHGMKDVNEGSLMQIYPSPEFMYISQLEKIENICRVMHFKTICFYRRKNQFEEKRANAKYIKEIISKAISFNPYIIFLSKKANAKFPSWIEIVNPKVVLEIDNAPLPDLGELEYNGNTYTIKKLIKKLIN